MALLVEVQDPQNLSWFKTGRFEVGDSPGSVSDNLTDGRRDIYLFVCLAHGLSAIYRSRGGADVEVGRTLRAVYESYANMELVCELHDGQTRELRVLTDVSSISRRIRFTQIPS